MCTPPPPATPCAACGPCYLHLQTHTHTRIHTRARTHTHLCGRPLRAQDVAARDLIFYYGVGWVHTLEEVHDKDSNAREAVFDTKPYIPKDVDALLLRQGPDNELYRLSQVGMHLLCCGAVQSVAVHGAGWRPGRGQARCTAAPASSYRHAGTCLLAAHGPWLCGPSRAWVRHMRVHMSEA